MSRYLLPVALVTSLLTYADLWTSTAHADEPASVSTFQSLSLYWTPTGARDGRWVSVRFRTVSPRGDWREGYPMPFAAIPDTTEERAAYRGSLVQLTAGTEYEVELTHRDSDGRALETASLSARTWNEHFPEHAEVTRVTGRSTPLVIDRSGSADAYRVYDGLQADGTRARIDVGVGNDSPLQAVRVDASYVILRNVEIIGGRHGIRIFSGTDIVIEDSDIHGWGHEDRRYGQRFGMNHNAAVKSTEESLARLVVQRTLMHHPFTNSNNWSECRLDLSGGNPCTESREYHPGGPQAIDLINSRGNHVFRYNAAYSDADHYFNDIFGGAYGWSDYGYIGHDTDIYGNYLANCWDDALELEGGIRNVRVWGNLIEKSYQALGNDAVLIGPLYFFRNVMRQSDRYANREEAGLAAKGGGQRDIADVPAYTFYFHNTIDNQRGDGFNGLGSRSRGLYHFVTRNNVLHTRGGPSVSTSAQSRGIDADYDLFSADVPDGSERNGIMGRPEFAVGSFDFESLSYDYRLRAGSLGVDDGQRIPNFNDGFTGAAPDIGAQESTTAVMRVGPGAFDACGSTEEICDNGVDDDCDGGVDEDCAAPVRPRLRVPRAASPPVIDGDPSDIPLAPLSLNVDESVSTIRASWNELGLYLGFEVTDEDVRAHVDTGAEGQVWLDDALQIFLDPERDGGSELSGADLQVVINALGATFTNRSSVYEAASTVSGTANDAMADMGYTVEVVVPWETLAAVPAVGMELGASFALSDRSSPDDGSARGANLSSRDWMGRTENFREPGSWGFLVLEDGSSSPSDAGMADAGVLNPRHMPGTDGGPMEIDPGGEGESLSAGCAVSTSTPKDEKTALILLMVSMVALGRRRRARGQVNCPLPKR